MVSTTTDEVEEPCQPMAQRVGAGRQELDSVSPQ
jgi:hypothetical protein